MAAPVKVARSITASGLASLANDRPSARISRPSASVFRISTVLPLRILSTSPKRVASPPSMLSVIGTHALTLTSGFSAGSADMAPRTAPPPPMSHFIVDMPTEVLIERPPASNVMPLPTSAMVGAPFTPHLYCISTRRGGRSLPRFTPSRPPSLAFLISVRPSTVIERPG